MSTIDEDRRRGSTIIFRMIVSFVLQVSFIRKRISTCPTCFFACIICDEKEETFRKDKVRRKICKERRITGAIIKARCAYSMKIFFSLTSRSIKYGPFHRKQFDVVASPLYAKSAHFMSQFHVRISIRNIPRVSTYATRLLVLMYKYATYTNALPTYRARACVSTFLRLLRLLRRYIPLGTSMHVYGKYMKGSIEFQTRPKLIHIYSKVIFRADYID